MTNATEIVARALFQARNTEPVDDEYWEYSKQHKHSVAQDDFRSAEIALTALREAGMLLEWRDDVENAPKGRDQILIYSPERLTCVTWLPEGGANNPQPGYFDWFDGMRFEPTHFALINPPKEKS